ncbi:MAG: 16S rRNA (cytidine(1402)-2'-O)-methyltransferase [Bacteroidota bacterium]
MNRFVLPETELQKIENAIYIVPTPIGNLKDITLRALEVLANVNLIAAEDTRTTKNLLNHFSIQTALISFYSHNQEFRIPHLIEKIKSGESIALVSDAGTPGISDPAFGLIKEAIEKNIKIIPLPGATAFVPALIASGLVTRSFVFEGFLPLKKGRKTKFDELKNETRTIVLYESPHRILKILNEILENFGERQISIGRELSKKFEEIIRGNTSFLINYFSNKEPKGEFVLVIEGLPKK